jgi:hypothetical protein
MRRRTHRSVSWECRNSDSAREPSSAPQVSKSLTACTRSRCHSLREASAPGAFVAKWQTAGWQRPTMSAFCPHAAPNRSSAHSSSWLRSWVALPLIATLACADTDGASAPQSADSGFGVPIEYPRDGGIDSGFALDAAVEAGPTVRVRFVHSFPNIGRLTVCHDNDGPSGPSLPYALALGTMNAGFGGESAELVLPQLRTGALTFHREAFGARGDGGLDGGASDAGPIDLCSSGTIEATVPLPIPQGWVDPLIARSAASGYDPAFSLTLSGAAPLTLLGSGLALSPSGLDQRAEQARNAWLSTHPGDTVGAAESAKKERERLEATFGPRALIQAVPTHQGGQTFSLSMFHGIPNLTDADAGADTEAAAIRLCVKAMTAVRNAFPMVPTPGVPFRMRAPLGTELETRLAYTFRVFVQGDFDREKKDCASTGLRPVAEATFPAGRFLPGRSYTLALLGAISAPELCSASSRSFIRPGCLPQTASDLAPRLEVLDD